MLFSDFFNRVSGYIGDVRLVFEFKEEGQGLVYYINDAGKLTEYFDSPYTVRDRAALSRNPIWEAHKHEFGGKIIVGYKGLWFVCLPSVWSPSIDAVMLIDSLLAHEKVRLQSARSIIDFGCGSGVVGIVLTKSIPEVAELYLVDNNGVALLSSVMNAFGNCVNEKTRITWLNSLGSQSADVGLVTPYYFPVTRDIVPDPVGTIVNCGIESAELVNRVARASMTTYFVYSSTTEKYFLETLKNDYSLLGECMVPFTLGDNVSSQAFLKAAVENGMLIQNDDSPFNYWHKIYVGKIGK